MTPPAPVKTQGAQAFAPSHGAPVSLRSLALCLAYVHHCNPVRPRRGRFPLLLRSAREINRWLGLPLHPGRAARDDLPLATHLALLVSGGLLALRPAGLTLAPAAMPWLRDLPEQQNAQLLDAAHSPAWDSALHELGLEDALPVDYKTFFLQTLARQVPSHPVSSSQPAAQLVTSPTEWRLLIQPGVAPGLLFELLGLGSFAPPDRITLTPLTLGTKRAQDLGYRRILLLLEMAAGQPLANPLRQTLRDWLGRAAAYRLLGPVLVTAQPEQLAALYATRRLRPYLLEQLSARSVLIDRRGTEPLRRWLASRGFHLIAGDSEPSAPAVPDNRDLYLSLRVLLGLQRFAPLPLPAPYASLEQLEGALEPEDVAGLAAQAAHWLSEIEAAIQGRDAFFPATRPVDKQTLNLLKRAIADEVAVSVTYCALGSAEPKRHVIEPLRLEQRDELVYLHAYSYRTESNLTFRLDRVEQCRLLDQTMSTAPNSLAVS